MEIYTFKKSTCEKYTIRWGSCGWAVFTIDEATGMFNCQSDYGYYNYTWSNHGSKSFKHSIIEIAKDSTYLLGKIATRVHFDYEKALKNWKSELIKMRRERDCDKNQARDAWDAITGLGDYSNQVQILQKELYEDERISELYGGEPWYIFTIDLDYSFQALAFANEVMPMFADLLKNEIEGKEYRNG